LNIFFSEDLLPYHLSGSFIQWR